MSTRKGGKQKAKATKVTRGTREQAVTAALRQSLTQEFLDVKFSVFSRRSACGSFVDKPRHVLANSSIVRAASSEILPPEGFSLFNFAEEQLLIDTYGYAADSDLEDEEDVLKLKPVEMQVAVTVHDEIMSPTSAELDITEVCRYRWGLPHYMTRVRQSPLPSLPGSSPTNEATRTSVSEEHDRFGRVVPVNDMAHKTWMALVFYLYTGEVVFALLKSQRQAKLMGLFGPPPCSPKSMYRLADKYGLSELKELAKEDIRSKLTPQNILEELFSDFASRYKEIYELEIDYFCEKCLRDTVSALPRWTGILARGELPHSGDMLATLIKKLATMSDGGVPAEVGVRGDAVAGAVNCHPVSTGPTESALAVDRPATTSIFSHVFSSPITRPAITTSTTVVPAPPAVATSAAVVPGPSPAVPGPPTVRRATARRTAPAASAQPVDSAFFRSTPSGDLLMPNSAGSSQTGPPPASGI
ncbi:hypothetical protein B0H21DRAFT_757506 [Amylocystis lapponica]|nr:hypothetical protein B0H21DRAFT_757506 [Amylocystis lapponica]